MWHVTDLLYHECLVGTTLLTLLTLLPLPKFSQYSQSICNRSQTYCVVGVPWVRHITHITYFTDIPQILTIQSGNMWHNTDLLCLGRQHLSPLSTTYYSHYSSSHKTILQHVTQHRPTVSWVSASLSSVITDITYFTDIPQMLTIQSVNMWHNTDLLCRGCRHLSSVSVSLSHWHHCVLVPCPRCVVKACSWHMWVCHHVSCLLFLSSLFSTAHRYFVQLWVCACVYVCVYMCVCERERVSESERDGDTGDLQVCR